MKKYLSFFLLSFAVSACMAQTEKNEKKLPVEVDELTQHVRKQFIPDKRVAIFDVDYRFPSRKEIIVKGATTSLDAKLALLGGLKESHYQITDSMMLLPDSAALEGKTYGIVNLSVCNLRVEPDFSSEMTSQALLGMPVKVLQRDGWYRVQTPDDYIAWVHRVGVYPVTKQAYDEWNRADKIVVTSQLEYCSIPF